MVPDEWKWDKNRKCVGIFDLESSVENYSKFIRLLENYDDENYETYEIENSNHSKLFVYRGIVKAIQSGKSFMVGNENLIGKELKNVFAKLELTFEDQNNDSSVLYNHENRLTLYSSEGIVLWITIDCWFDWM